MEMVTSTSKIVIRASWSVWRPFGLNFTNSTLADTMRAVPSLKSAIDRRDTTQSSCTHACEARGAVWARGAVARGAVARRRSRGAQNVKVDGEWL